MKIRLVYMRTEFDGFCIDEEWDISILPRIGERVVLPEGHLEVLKEKEPSLQKGTLMTIRYEVIGVEHRWDELGQKPVVSITKLHQAAE